METLVAPAATLWGVIILAMAMITARASEEALKALERTLHQLLGMVGDKSTFHALTRTEVLAFSYSEPGVPPLAGTGV